MPAAVQQPRARYVGATVTLLGQMPRGVPLPRLRALREAAFLTQDELAKRAGLARNVVVHAENGASVRFTSARKLATALGVEPAALASGVHAPPLAPEPRGPKGRKMSGYERSREG